MVFAAAIWFASTPAVADDVLGTGKWQLVSDEAPNTKKHKDVRITLDAESEVVGWPDDRRETPHLAVSCTRGKLRVFVVTKLRPEVYGDYYDDYLALTRIGFDGQDPDEWRLRRSVSGEQVYFPRAKQIVRELLVNHTMFFEFTPFSSPPTHTTFDLTGFRQAVQPLKDSCKIQTDTVPGG